MITSSPERFLEAHAALLPSGDGRATMRAALLVSPEGFSPGPHTAPDNRYLSGDAVDPERAANQHAAVVRALGALGVPVILFAGRPGLPDGIWPNNVFATAGRRLIVGSMRHEARRGETEREDVRQLFTGLLGYEIVDLSRRRCIAELTGPVVVDRARAVGYCGMSERVDEAGSEAMHEAFGLRLTFRFALQPGEYHTNLVLAVLAGRACLIHPGSLADPAAAGAIARAWGERCVPLDDEEKAAFCGNSLAVTDRDVLFSQRALRALRPGARRRLERLGFRLHGVEIDELEKGGGSLRCLIAEIY